MIVVKVVHQHVDPSEEDDYHEWVVTKRRASLDSRGRPNPRMIAQNWRVAICNNLDCFALGYVHEDAITGLLKQAEASDDGTLRA